MRLTLLGTGNAAQVPVYNCHCVACQRAHQDSTFRRGPCSALIEHDDQRWLVDAGQVDLTRRFPPHSLSGILQTHYHADHAQGLLQLRWGQDMRIPVLGPPDPEGLGDLYINPGILDFSKALDAFESVQLGPLAVTPLPLNHTKLTYGYAFTDGTAHFAYLTDTIGLPSDTHDYLCQNPLDLLVIDCTYAPQPEAPRNHNDLTRALETIGQLPVEKAVLTHISHDLDAWLMANPDALPANVSVAKDGDIFP